MPAPNAPALILRRLSKSFGRLAVDRLDLTIGAGELYALLGPNGVGKTTTLRLVAGLSGRRRGIEIFGVDARAAVAAKRLVAWLPDEPMLYDRLAHGISRVRRRPFWGGGRAVAARRAARLLRAWACGRSGSRTLRRVFARHEQQTRGSRRRCIHEPQLLILDEPLTGLDAGAPTRSRIFCRLACGRARR